MPEPYDYCRFRWWMPLDLDEAMGELESFGAKKKVRPRGEAEMTLYADERDEVYARADTLAAMLAPYRAILYQMEWRPFTARDMSLRAWVFKKYDKTTPTPLPWGGDSEPRYEVEGRGTTEKPILLDDRTLGADTRAHF